MISFKCDTKQKEEIKDFLFAELSKMYLRSICALDIRDSLLDEADYERVAKGFINMV